MTPQHKIVTTAFTVGGILGSALLLTGCGGGPATVDGNRDDMRFISSKPAVKRTASRTVPVYANRCQTKTRTKTTGSGKTRKTTTERYQDCNKVRTGSRTEQYLRTISPAKPSKYCLELDNVNGDTSDDDQWFEVSAGTYADHINEPEGKEIKDMSYYRMVSSCH